LCERAPPAKGWRQPPGRIPETLFVVPLDRPLGSCRKLRFLSRAGPAPTRARFSAPTRGSVAGCR
jgi:hypothetical protein